MRGKNVKLQVISDIHVEFYSQGKANKLLDSLRHPDADGIIIAGDFGVGQSSRYIKHLRRLCELWPLVLIVPGNHDHWLTEYVKLQEVYAQVHREFPHFHSLDLNFHEIDKSLIAFGSTLWFRDDGINKFDGVWIDYLKVPGSKQAIQDMENTGRTYLKTDIKEFKTSIILTHHMPSHNSVNIQYHGYSTNKFFVNDVEEIIYQYQPTYWIHGHTHDSCDYKMGDTRILCNPMGYPGDFGLENRNFDKDLMIEV